jgi:hypothetical protein
MLNIFTLLFKTLNKRKQKKSFFSRKVTNFFETGHELISNPLKFKNRHYFCPFPPMTTFTKTNFSTLPVGSQSTGWWQIQAKSQGYLPMSFK